MPALRTLLNRPRLWLACAAVFYMLIIADTFREPDRQVTGWAYVKLVRVYQSWGRPLLAGRVVCRFSPSCSEYSIGSVEKHGIRDGLWLTQDRLSRCAPETPHRTIDQVP